MSTVASPTLVPAPASAGRTSVQIAVPINPADVNSGDAMLEAAIQRVSTMLYLRAHCLAPPSATDLGGGLFNILV